MVIRKGTKEQTMINQTLHRTLKISQHKFHLIVPAPLIAPVVLLLNDTDMEIVLNTGVRKYIQIK